MKRGNAFTSPYNTGAQINSRNREAQQRRLAEAIDLTLLPAADLGPPNSQKRILVERLQIPIISIEGNIDFNWDAIPGRWGTLFCLEILEHVLNPLLFLRNVRAALAEGGTLYLSTPYRPSFLWTEHHWHEISDDRLAYLFRLAGLEVVWMQRIRLFYGWRWHLRGVRPMLRLFTFTRLYKLRRMTDGT